MAIAQLMNKFIQRNNTSKYFATSSQVKEISTSSMMLSRCIAFSVDGCDWVIALSSVLYGLLPFVALYIDLSVFETHGMYKRSRTHLASRGLETRLLQMCRIDTVSMQISADCRMYIMRIKLRTDIGWDASGSLLEIIVIYTVIDRRIVTENPIRSPLSGGRRNTTLFNKTKMRMGSKKCRTWNKDLLSRSNSIIV